MVWRTFKYLFLAASDHRTCYLPLPAEAPTTIRYWLIPRDLYSTPRLPLSPSLLWQTTKRLWPWLPWSLSNKSHLHCRTSAISIMFLVPSPLSPHAKYIATPEKVRAWLLRLTLTQHMPVMIYVVHVIWNTIFTSFELGFLCRADITPLLSLHRVKTCIRVTVTRATDPIQSNPKTWTPLPHNKPSSWSHEQAVKKLICESTNYSSTHAWPAHF